MDFLYLVVVEAADLLQNLSLDSDSSTIGVPEPAKVVSVCTTIALVCLELQSIN